MRNQREMCLEAKRAPSSLQEENESNRAEEEAAHFGPAAFRIREPHRWQEFNSEIYCTYSSGPLTCCASYRACIMSAGAQAIL